MNIEIENRRNLMSYKYLILIIIGFLIPIFFIFKSLFSLSPAVWGDAPYFYPQGLSELISEPLSWTERGKSFGGINQVLFLSPIMFLYGLFHTIFGFGNDMIIRILFYFPGIILATLGVFILSRYLKLSIISQFFASFIYIVNTYFALLVDGGQVGIVLAYGIFPFALLFLRKLSDKYSVNKLYLSIIILAVLEMVDPRIAILVIISIVAWNIIEFFITHDINKIVNLKYIFLSVLGANAINLYWIYPLLSLQEKSGEIQNIPLQLTSILHALTLYQPHWPLNEFGKITYPQAYFILLPILVIIGLFLDKSKNYLTLFILMLLFVFLTKGTTPPFGKVYEFVLTSIPYGISFRDSTKFFIPLILFYGLLFGTAVQAIINNPNLKKYNLFLIFSFWIFLIFLVSPAITGHLNGVLSDKPIPNEIKEINKRIQNIDDFSRTVWIPEKHPFAFESTNSPAINGKDLVNFRPFSTLNTGTYDSFNFLHNISTQGWFKLLGVKYFSLSGDFRKIAANKEEKESWDKLKILISSQNYLKQVEGLPLYETEVIMPNVFTTNKLFVVVGGDDIYEKIKIKKKDFSLENQGFVFIEDGKWDPRSLHGIASESAVVIFNEKQEEDLTLSFLQKYFIIPDSKNSKWAIHKASDYLKWKYELLNNGVDIKEFDYNKGIAFSTVKREKLVFKSNKLNAGKYVLAIRGLSKGNEEALRVLVNDKVFTIPLTKGDKFDWFTNEVDLQKGDYIISIENNSPFSVVNVVALVPFLEWQKANEITKSFIGTFSVFDNGNFDKLPTGEWKSVEINRLGATRFGLELSKNKWLVYTDVYHPLWSMKKGVDNINPIPFYSMINGFYTENGGKANVYFKGQENFRWGIWFSILTILSLSIIYFWFNSNEKNNQ